MSARPSRRRGAFGRVVASLVAGLAVVLVGIGVSACGETGGGVEYRAATWPAGDAVSVDELRGRPALLVSWATWCKECDEELAGLEEFAASPDAEGLELVAVNLDAADVEDDIRAKIERHGLSMTLWRDADNEFKRSFGALGVPTTVLLDAEGRLVDTFPGAVDFDDEDVLAALAEVRNGA